MEARVCLAGIRGLLRGIKCVVVWIGLIGLYLIGSVAVAGSIFYILYKEFSIQKTSTHNKYVYSFDKYRKSLYNDNITND